MMEHDGERKKEGEERVARGRKEESKGGIERKVDKKR